MESLKHQALTLYEVSYWRNNERYAGTTTSKLLVVVEEFQEAQPKKGEVVKLSSCQGQTNDQGHLVWYEVSRRELLS